jgi:hypothetical protein
VRSKAKDANAEDLDALAAMNMRLIADEKSRNPMTVSALRERMRGWLESGMWTIDVLHTDATVVGYL